MELRLLESIRRSLAGVAIAAIGLGIALPAANAQGTWKPSAPIKLVVPWPPGGATDLLARVLAPGVSERLGQPVVVENRPGAAGSIGSTFVYESRPDGTTLLVGTVDNSIYPLVYKSARYDPTKFVPVASFGASPFVLLGRSELPANNLQEFLALARKQSLSYANAGMGGSPHVLVSAFGRVAKVDNQLHVPFQGMAPALQALLGNQADVLMVVTGGAAQYQGRLKFLGLASAQRMQSMANVPTLTEQGVPFVGEAWYGMLAPPGTPAAIVQALSRAFTEVASTPAYASRVVDLGGRHMVQSQEEFTKFYLDDYNKWVEVVRTTNIKVD